MIEDNNYEDKNFKIWKKRWKIRLLLNNNTPEKYIKLMRSVNPLVIPRNQKVEESLKVAEQNDLKKINQLLEDLRKSIKYLGEININQNFLFNEIYKSGRFRLF